MRIKVLGAMWQIDPLMLLSFVVLAGASAFWWRRWAGTPKKEEKK